jgi:hypothetical protein
LRVRKMCGTSVHRSSRLPTIAFQQPASFKHLPRSRNMRCRRAPPYQGAKNNGSARGSTLSNYQPGSRV